MAHGFKSKDSYKTTGNVHNCYSDVKNYWINNTENCRLDMILSVFTVFLTGLLLMQIAVFLVKHQDTDKVVNGIQEDLWIDTFIDYALDSNGAEVIEEYSLAEYMGWFTVMSSNKRKAVLSQNNEPGNCWAFDGSYGYIGIKLAARILPRNFTIFHLNSVQYFTAPKILNVYSLDYIDECVLLAKYEFDLRIQGVRRKNWGIFECQDYCDFYVERVLLEVEENYGATGTCVYQFKVHGVVN